MGVVLGIYLFRLGLSSFTIGLAIAAGLAGSALATIIVSVAADRLGRRQSLLVLSLLTGIGGLALSQSRALGVPLTMVHRHAEWYRHGSLGFFCPRPSHCSRAGSGFQNPAQFYENRFAIKYTYWRH
jgi:MFS family permease